MLVSLGVILADRQRPDAFTPPEEARREDARVVQHKSVTRVEKRWEIPKNAVLPAILVAVQNEHSRAGAVFGRRLSDQFFGKLIVETG
jgi:hypothetical protein